MTTQTMEVGGQTLPLWPDYARAVPLAAQYTAQTDFHDTEHYHARLIERILELEQDRDFCDPMFPGGCGHKIRDIHRWNTPESRFLDARAKLFCSRLLSGKEVFVDASWASVYRAGDYCMAHSHLRCVASIVYMLDPGDPPADDPMNGRFTFCDPRIPECCPVEPGRMTALMIPELKPGSMLFFASEFLHAVNPYTGTRPRITLSWNVTLEKLPGTPGAWTK